MPKFDLDKTAALERLFAVPRQSRDAAWVEAFYAAVPDASLRTGDGQVVRGPDGFPYFRLIVPEPFTEFETFCVTHVLDVCLENGFGIVVMTGDPRPQWVFRYGNLWSYRENGRFEVPDDGPAAAPGDRILVGSPSDHLLPAPIRAVLRKELEAQGVTDPGVLLVRLPGGSPGTALAFDPPPPDRQRLLWYLPPHVALTDVAQGWPDPTPL